MRTETERSGAPEGEENERFDRKSLRLATPTGRTRATRYFVPPSLLKAVNLDIRTTLKRVQPHRLRALILEDLDRFPGSSSSEIHRRIGPEINARTLKRAIDAAVKDGLVVPAGKRRWTKYTLVSGGSKGQVP